MQLTSLTFSIVDHLSRESSSLENSGADCDTGLSHSQSNLSVSRPAQARALSPARATSLRALAVSRPSTCVGPAGAHHCCLLDMLREEDTEEEEEGEKISQEEIQSFHSRLPFLNSEREKLR